MTIVWTIVLITISSLIYLIYYTYNSRTIRVSITFPNCPTRERKAAILNASMTLKEVRKELSVNDENGKCIMEDDMLFCDLNNAQIRQIDEGKYYLGIILNEMNVICITRCKTLEEVIPHLIRQRKLDCGIRWTESGPAQSDNVAFKFKSYAVMGDRIEYIERAFEQTNNRKRSVLCENGIEWKLDLKTLWQSTGLGAHFTNERSNESSTNHRKYRHVQRHIRATLFMKSEHIEPSDNFKNEVEEAVGLLDLGAKSAKLKEICEKYGYFWAREVHLGGMIINTEEERENANVQSARRRGGLDINMKTGPSELRSGISQNNDRLNQNSSSNANTKFTVIGGDLNTYIHPGDESKWHRTLQDSSTWEIIHYEDIVPIYEIFEERIQNAIREIFRAKVCYSGIDVLDLQEKNFCIRPIRFPPNVWEGIRQHQIFAEVMYEGEPDTMFAANIEQTEGLPNVRVSKIQASGSRNYNFFRKKSKLKLAYIITGYPKSSDSQTKDELSVEVAVVQGEKKNDKFVASLPEVTNIQGFYQKAVLITCYITQQTMLAMQKTGSKRRDSDNCIVFTMHLHKPDDVRPTEVCISAYSCTANGAYKMKDLPQESIKIAYCIITDKQQKGISKKIEFSHKNPRQFEKFTKKSDAYRALFSNQACNSTSQSSVFTNIVLPSEHCVPVFRLTTKKRIVYCSGQDYDSKLEGSFIYFHHEVDNDNVIDDNVIV